MEIEGMAEVEAGVLAFQLAVAGAMKNAGGEISSLLTNYAKGHHLWMDRTGNTQSSTRARVIEATAEKIVISLTAGMTYDVYLELFHQGKWSWLAPAIEACKPDIMASLTRNLATVGAGFAPSISSVQGFHDI